MTTKHLIGAAAVALLAATGAARAADVMPIVVATTPAVAPVVVGPTVTVEITTGAYLDLYGLTDLYLGAETFGEIDVKSASGWGFNLAGGAGVNFIPGFGFGYGFRAELYRVIGNAEVGFFVVPYNFAPLVIAFGPTVRFETDRFEFRHQTEINYFFGNWDVGFSNDVTVHVSDSLDVGGYFDFSFGTFGLDLDLGVNAELEVNDRLTVEGWARADVIGGLFVAAGGQATFNLGALSPYVGVEARYDMGFGLEVTAGVELERPIGTGPFTLIGGAGMEYDLGGGLGLEAHIGIRFNRGDRDNLVFGDDVFGS